MKKESLFPVYYNHKPYYKKDCDQIFLDFYNCRESLNVNGGVYLSEDIWVYPDGSMGVY